MSRRRMGRKFPIVSFLAVVLLLLTATVASALAPSVIRISGNGGSGGQGSWSPNMTGNGRFVVFNSYSDILVPGDTNNTRDTFLYDLQTTSVERVNLTATGQEGNSESHTGHASADGRYIAFSSVATNFTTGATGGYSHVYVKDRQSGELELVSATPAANPGSGYSDSQGISADGRYVLVFSYASDLAGGDTNVSPELFLRDLQAGSTERVAVSGDEAQGDTGSEGGTLTPDAHFVAFDSQSTNLVPGDTNTLSDVFLRDRQAGTTERVNVSSSGGQATGGTSIRPRLSPDGRYVVFQSRATNIVDDDSNGMSDVYLRDRQLGTTERVSLTHSGSEANGESYDADVSADGRYVVFASAADNLVPGDTNSQTDIFLRDRQMGTTVRLNVAADGEQAIAYGSYNCQMSGDGRFVSFDSGATNLVPGDTNGVWDVFLLDRGPQAPPAPAFTDISSSPYKVAIEDLAGAGVINGYQVGDTWEFRPGNRLWRAQFAKMIVGSWGFPVTEDQSFVPFTDLGADTLTDPYPHEFVGVAYQKGITTGTTATTFSPFVNIKRAQLITMVVRSIKSEDPRALQEPPTDWHGELPSSDKVHGENIRIAEFNDLLAGISLSGWNVWGDADRGETTQILYNMRGL